MAKLMIKLNHGIAARDEKTGSWLEPAGVRSVKKVTYTRAPSGNHEQQALKGVAVVGNDGVM
jgi:hypothetical protein